MKTQLNHIAVLVKSIDNLVQSQIFTDSELGPIETFESEGTKEIYIGPNSHRSKLLLLEAISEGPYQKALKKRGPGLHHICIDVLNIMDFLDSLSGSGWYLHTSSLNFYQNCKQVFLARSGTAVLIEVNQVKQFSKQAQFIENFSFPFNNKKLLSALYCPSLSLSKTIQFELNNQTLKLDDLLKI